MSHFARAQHELLVRIDTLLDLSLIQLDLAFPNLT